MQRTPDRTGFFQNVGAGFQQAVAGPHSTRNAEAIYQTRSYDQIVKALSAEGEQGVDYIESPVRANSPLYRRVEGERVNPNGVVYVPVRRSFRNPFVSGPSLTVNVNPIQGLYLGGDQGEREQIWAAVQRVRQRNPGFLKGLDEATVAKQALDQRQKDLEAAGQVTGRASTLGQVGAFIGGAAGSVASLDPENIVGGGAGTAAGKTVARTVLKRAAEGAAVNAAAGTLALPGQVVDAQHLGQEMTPEDMLRSVGENALAGAVLGGAHAAAPAGAKAAGRAALVVAGKVAEHLPASIRDPVVAASIRAGTVKDRDLLHEFQRLHNPYGVVDTSHPDERAAAHVVIRDAEVQESSPLQPSAVAHNQNRLQAVADSLGMDLKAPDLPTAAPIATPTVRDHSAAATAPKRPASFAEGINAAEGHTRNPRSTADGYGNFIDDTWLSVAPKVTDTTGLSRQQILQLRHDKTIAMRATDYYAAQNGRYLRIRGLEDSPGNLSLAHFLGPEGAAKVLKADPATPVENLLPGKVIRANHEVLQGKSADEVIAWAHRRIGSSVDHPPARAEADEGYDYTSPVPYTIETLRPDEVTTNAALMQYKSGGDEHGVTDALQGVEQWNPLLSQQILAWEPNEGGRIVVDGHQRVALAKRLSGQDDSISLPTIIVREADGVTAEQARVLGALRNIANGTGTLLDNAKVLRDAPEGAAMLPSNAALARESIGLSRLSYEAFGAVVNELVDPRVAAHVGLNAGHAPESHMTLIDLLRRERITNSSEARGVIQQALADGFGTVDEQQLSLLGEAPQQALYVPAARIMGSAAKRLREEKRTFKVLGQKAGQIEAAGNVLDRTANESKVISNDEALAILERTAHRAGPVRDALIRAARAELSGSRRGDAVGQFLDELGSIDLRAAAAGVGEDGSARGASVSEGLALADQAPDGDLFERSEPRAATVAFSDPAGAGPKAQTDSLLHDLGMDEEPVQLFDVPDTGFRLSEEGDKPQTLREILDEADSDEQAAQALAECLKPPVGEP
ncbi:hypothetical protein [Sphingomonas sp. URHD0057]|uniref:hypothetical protein n=1 Tax=Sphingomonas sp. URHD0057 TaxID=1380389 RepID=UPI000490EEE9|nr:hypothetical protein [Sphingomonas sp. URHD0057]